MKKYVYSFNEGSKEMKDLLGGKGANLAEMTRIGLPVPFGFTITTEACNRYYEEKCTVADDVVEVQRRWGRFLVGSCPEMLKHYIEVRGLGILDVELLFGIGSTLDEMKIEMEVELTPPAQNIDRLGLEQKTSRILGVELPSLTIPVTPGRNLAVLIEVAVLNQQLKSQGIFAAKEFNQKMLCRMNKTAKRNGTKA